MLASVPIFADQEPEEKVVDDVPDVRMPEVTKFPAYPPIARRARIEGEATVCFKIAPDGRILDAEIESSTNEVFEKPALEAIRGSSFEALAPGEPLSATPVCRTYRFRLDPPESTDEV